RIALAHVDAELELVVQPLTGAELGRLAVCRWPGLSDRARKTLLDADAGSAAVVADGHPFVVGQQRVVGAELPAHCRGMVQRDIEIGVVANMGRRGVFGIGLGDQDRKSTRLNSSHVKISYAVFCLKKKQMR